jgi:hypothetical protein
MQQLPAQPVKEPVFDHALADHARERKIRFGIAFFVLIHRRAPLDASSDRLTRNANSLANAYA